MGWKDGICQNLINAHNGGYKENIVHAHMDAILAILDHMPDDEAKEERAHLRTTIEAINTNRQDLAEELQAIDRLCGTREGETTLEAIQRCVGAKRQKYIICDAQCEELFTEEECPFYDGTGRKRCFDRRAVKGPSSTCFVPSDDGYVCLPSDEEEK